jgi:hypothetical protein
MSLIFEGKFWMRREWGAIIPCPNAMTVVAINDLMDTYFRNGTPSPNWYFGLIRDDNFTALSSADTMASHTGWEEGDEYSGNRLEWAPSAAAGQILINTSFVDLTITTAQTFKGLFIADDNTRGGSTGTLWSTGLFDADQAVAVNEEIGLKYQLTCREG